jgi:GTP-binding protein
VISNSQASACPADGLPEYAFIGRSNVGKSSLINMLTGHSSLARTSGTPGKTQLINHYRINEDWYLVDLPGYGYARVSKKERAKFRELIESYFRSRTHLFSAFVLVDIRHEPQSSDLEFMRWLHEEEVPFSIVFTKADKLSEKQIPERVNSYLDSMTSAEWEQAPSHFVTSSEKKWGREDLLAYIEGINTDYKDYLKSGKQ